MNHRIPTALCLGWLASTVMIATPALAQTPPQPQPQQNAMLVLDASGSMWGQLQGRSKIEIARDAVADMLKRWPQDHHLGLLAYGHNRKGDCKDIQTLVEPGPLDRAGFLGRVNGLNPMGMTPLSAAVIAAADVLRSSEQKATVILVSDGEETCSMDPCQVGRELEARGVDFTAHVIGFDVPDPAHQAQLRCLAQHTGGQYFNARDAAELGSALEALVSVSTQESLPPASASVTAPAQAAAASRIEAQYEGPADPGDYLAIVSEQAGVVTEHSYNWVKPDQPKLSLDTPATPGNYQVQYLSPRREPKALASRPIVITDIAAHIEAPDSVVAGSTIEVLSRGPLGDSHWVGFAPKGGASGDYLDYQRPMVEGQPLALRAPAEPGEYELRYVLNGAERVVFSRPIQVTAAQVRIEAPSRVQAGDRVEITAHGPAEQQHWIGFATRGADIGSHLDYKRPNGAVSQLHLGAPATPGEYEIRYVLNESERIVATHAVTVEEARATLEAPAQVQVGQPISIELSGPAYEGHWVGVAPVGSEPGAYLDYGYVTASPTRVQLTAPQEPGNYELRYVLYSDRVLLSRPLQVLP